ncbi:MAG: hypothetical protein JWM90_1727 [Thermoleophilia bacterium]|nr:hypothetical protein [Thermoleophilia bacterium]
MAGGFDIARASSAAIGSVVVGAGTPERALLDVVRAGDGHLFMDVMQFRGRAADAALASGLQRGGSMDMLASPLLLRDTYATRPALADFQASGDLRVHPYVNLAAADGAPDAWQHSKLLAREGGSGDAAWFGNIVSHDVSSGLVDSFIQLNGATRDAAIDVARAWRDGARPRLTEATDAARRGGLLINDAAVRANHLSEALDGLVDSAQRRITWVTKGIDDPTTVDALVNARRRGVDVSIVVQKLSREDAKALKAGQVPVVLASAQQTASRINLLVADDVGILSSAYPTSSVLRPDASGHTAGRESGILIRGDGLDRVVAAVRETSEGAMAWREPGARVSPFPDGSHFAAQGFQLLTDVNPGAANLVASVK